MRGGTRKESHKEEKGAHGTTSTTAANRYAALSELSEPVVDCGATRTIIRSRSSLTNYRKGTRGNESKVIKGAGGNVKINGRGDAHIATNTGSTIVIKDAIHASNMQWDLLASGDCARAGIGTVLWPGTEDSNTLQLSLFDRDTGKVIGEGETSTKSGLYRLKPASTTCKSEKRVIIQEFIQHNEICLVNDTKEMKTTRKVNMKKTSRSAPAGVTFDLMHERLGHLGNSYVEKLLHGDLIAEGDKYESLTREMAHHCEACERGKHTRLKFKTGQQSRATRMNARVHMDIGVMEVEDMQGHKYYITFKDDYSRHLRVYLLKRKSDALAAFKSYKAHVEKRFVTRIGALQLINSLRMDNASEFVTGQFRAFMEHPDNSIEYERTAPHTPQSNGISERTNRVLIELTVSMLDRARLPKRYWGWALLHAVHLANITPSKATPGTTPFELAMGRKPTVDDLRVFGCPAYAHVPKALRKKLDAKCIKCIYLGRGAETAAHLCYEPRTGKYIISRDVTFDEKFHTAAGQGRLDTPISGPASEGGNAVSNTGSATESSDAVDKIENITDEIIDGATSEFEPVTSLIDAINGDALATVNTMYERDANGNIHLKDGVMDTGTIDGDTDFAAGNDDFMITGTDTTEPTINAAHGTEQSNTSITTPQTPSPTPSPADTTVSAPSAPVRHAHADGIEGTRRNMLNHFDSVNDSARGGASDTTTTTSTATSAPQASDTGTGESTGLRRSTRSRTAPDRLIESMLADLEEDLCPHLSGARKLSQYQQRKIQPRLTKRNIIYIYAVEEVDELVSILREPKTLREAYTGPHADKWRAAIGKEYGSLQTNCTWELVLLPKGERAINSGWVFKVKRDADGNVTKHKARFVAKGYSQREGVDYTETFSPVARLATLRTALALANQNDMEIHGVDFETAFLNANCTDKVFMHQSKGEGHIKEGEEHLVCRLKKTLYGLKQSPREWNRTLHMSMIGWGWRQSKVDKCLYLKHDAAGKLIAIACIWVDDTVLCTRGLEEMAAIKAQMFKDYKCTDEGELTQILGMKVRRDRVAGTLQLSSEAYIESMLHDFNMTECNTTRTPAPTDAKLTVDSCPKTDAERKEVETIPYRSLVGALQHLVQTTRPDIAVAVGECARFQSNPGIAHWTAAKRILRYLKGTKDKGVTYQRSGAAGTAGGKLRIEGYSDADWGGNKDNARSTSGFVYIFCGGPVAWGSRGQKSVALSTMEAEYMALCLCAQEGEWLNMLLTDAGVEVEMPYVIFEDNQSAIALCKDPCNQSRAKHINIKYHFVRERMEDGSLKVVYLNTKEMLADAFTKALAADQFEVLIDGMGVRSWHDTGDTPLGE